MKNKPLETAIKILESELSKHNTNYTSYEMLPIDIFLNGWKRYKEVEIALNYLKELRKVKY
jgi:hypothetical protein